MTFLIKSNALKLLTHIYQNCDCGLSAKKLDCTNLFSEDFTKDDLSKSYFYLRQKNFIVDNTRCVPTGNINAEITAIGIDWVEECNGVKFL